MTFEVDADRFGQLIDLAVTSLPDRLRQEVDDEVWLTVEDRHRAGHLGLYEGTPLTERSSGSWFPSKVTLYRLAICESAAGEGRLLDVITETLKHEVGHHFGLNDDQMREVASR